MNHFHYKDGVLCAEDVPLDLLAEAAGTPFYCYSSATLQRQYKVFADALPKDSLIAFSVKANGNLAVLKTLAKMGAGADVVSGGELFKAMAAGIPAAKIVFSGVGKTAPEMRAALEAGIYQFNVESELIIKTCFMSERLSNAPAVPSPAPARCLPGSCANARWLRATEP